MLAWFMAHFPNSILQLFGSAYFSRLGGNSYLSWIWLRSRHFDCDNYSTWYWTSWLISYVSHMNLDPTRQGAHQKSGTVALTPFSSWQVLNWAIEVGRDYKILRDTTRYPDMRIWYHYISLVGYFWLLRAQCALCGRFARHSGQRSPISVLHRVGCFSCFFMFFHHVVWWCCRTDEA